MSGEGKQGADAVASASGKGSESLLADLRRWADARDRRYLEDHPHGAHGKKGTALLRDSADEIERLRHAVEGLLDWAERFQAGDPSLDPEEWYINRDFARVVLGRA